MEKLNEIQNILLKLHKISHRQAKTLSTNILAVNEGYKIGFIWDIGPPVTLSQVKFIFDKLKSEKLIKIDDILLITLKDDICLLNKRIYLEFKIIPAFIDVSKTLKKPKLLLSNDERIKEIINNIKNQIECCGKETSSSSSSTTSSSSSSLSTVDVLDLKIDDSLYCVPTILGMLAGYPIVYWYDPTTIKDSHQQHCITDIDLIIYKLLRDSEIICSFSCPKDLIENNEIKLKIDAWKNDIKSFTDCRIEFSTSRTNCSVNL